MNSRPPFGFNVIGLFSSAGGQGVAAANTVQICRKLSLPHCVIDVGALVYRKGQATPLAPDGTPCAGGVAPYAVNLFHVNPPEAHRVMRSLPAWLKVSGRLNVCVPFWELTRLPVLWMRAAAPMDALLAPSRFIAHTLSNFLPRRVVRYFPQTVFLPDPLPTLPKWISLPNGVFRFAVSVDLRSDVRRKNPEDAIAAFQLAFPRERDVALVLKINRGRTGDRLMSALEPLLALARRDTRIVVIDAVLSYEETIALYAACDSLLSLHRAEGLGLPLMEAMMLGKPVIATNWSGNLDFMNDENSCLVNCDFVAVDTDQDVGYQSDQLGFQGTWAQPIVPDAAYWLRRVYEDRAWAAQIGRRAMLDMGARQQFCLEGNALKALDGLRQSVDDERRAVVYMRARRRSNARRLHVALCNRFDAIEHPGGDTVVMGRLQARLRTHGVETEVLNNSFADLSRFDLVHVFNFTMPQLANAFVSNAALQYVPCVATPIQEDFGRYAECSRRAVEMFERYLDEGQPKDGFASMHAALTRSDAQGWPIGSEYAAARVERMLACAAAERDLLVGMYPDGAPVSVVPFGADTAMSDVDAEEFERQFGVRDFVLCVGRLETRKNQLMLLKALEDEEVTLVFADGGFTYNAGYADLCRRFRRRGRTIFTGRLSDRLLASAYRAAAVHCLPSWYELPGLTTLEAASSCRSIVASSWGAIRDYLDDTIDYCEPSDPESVRCAVLGGLKLPNGDAARSRVRAYSWERMGREVLRIYEDVLAGYTPSVGSAALGELRTPLRG